MRKSGAATTLRVPLWHAVLKRVAIGVIAVATGCGGPPSADSGVGSSELAFPDVDRDGPYYERIIFPADLELSGSARGRELSELSDDDLNKAYAGNEYLELELSRRLGRKATFDDAHRYFEAQRQRLIDEVRARDPAGFDAGLEQVRENLRKKGIQLSEAQIQRAWAELAPVSVELRELGAR